MTRTAPWIVTVTAAAVIGICLSAGSADEPSDEVARNVTTTTAGTALRAPSVATATPGTARHPSPTTETPTDRPGPHAGR